MRIRPLVLLLGLLAPFAGACGGAAIGDQPTCQQLSDEYSSAYPAAIACVPGAANQCQQQGMSDSPSCACGSTVEDAAQINAIVAQMISEGCIHQALCPCPAALNVGCVPNDGGSGGTCAPMGL